MTGGAGQRLATAARESVTLGLVKGGARALRRGSVPASIDPAADASDLAVVRRIVICSRLAGPAWRLVADVSHGWAESEALRHVVARWRRFDALPLAQRARAAGFALVAATVADGLIALADRRPASDYRWLMWSALLATGLLIVASAEGIGAAWPESWLSGRQRER